MCAQWLQYTEWELAQQQPARAQFVYERALSEGGACLYDVVWERYSDMLINSLHAKVLHCTVCILDGSVMQVCTTAQ